jgi:MoaA/NifB/PqqE/SkfB family radical SAM enzyme
MKIPISKLGKTQRIDVEKSTGIVFHDNIARICTVVKDKNAYDNRGDKSPYRMAELFGGDWHDYNNHFIVQAAGCPLKCPYCYVDNLKANLSMSADDLVKRYAKFKEIVEPRFNIKVNVLHFMGGAPALYCKFWKELRDSLDNHGFKDTVMFSDVILVENYFAKQKPWKMMDLHHFIVTGCLKGTSKENFVKNTGFDLFEQSLKELKNYLSFKNFYLTLIGCNEAELPKIYKIIPRDRIDFLNIINYEVTKKKKELLH